MGHCDGLASRRWCVERETEKGDRDSEAWARARGRWSGHHLTGEAAQEGFGRKQTPVLGTSGGFGAKSRCDFGRCRRMEWGQ